MKFALVHLSGPKQGETQYFDRAWLSLGSDPVNDVVLWPDGSPSVSPIHAEFFEADCVMRLRNRASDTGTWLNDQPVDEAMLHDEDSIQFGPNGPKLRFRIRPEEYAACKLVREILDDARAVAAETRGQGLGPIGSFVGQLAYDLRRHASWSTQVVMIAVLALLLSVVAGALYSGYQTRAAFERHMTALTQERAGAERVIAQYGSSVCFLYVAYEVQKGAKAAVSLEYMGTGFLVDDRGHIVTNRHLTEPWTIDPLVTERVKAGAVPTLISLLAFFPGKSAPYRVSPLRVSKVADVALGRLSPIPKGVTPIPITPQKSPGAIGEAVVLLGYPTGVEGVLARMEDDQATALMATHRGNLKSLVQAVSDLGAVRPLATQGHVGDIVANRIVYDAQTTGGGSGSPVFNSRGEVIAVNAATMTRFGGASFGVPIGEAVKLLLVKE